MTATVIKADENNTKAISSPKKSDNIYGSFFLEGTELAVSIEYVQEVVFFPESMALMPLAPEYLIGIFNLRGTVMPIVNLKKLMKLNKVDVDKSQKIAILDYNGVNVGFAFDSTGEILRPKSDELNEFEYQKESKNKVIRGALKLEEGKRLLQILDPEALISIHNFPQLAEHKRSSRQDFFHRKTRSNLRKCICFSVGVAKLAIEITGIHEIVTIPEIKNSAAQSNICLGIINLRGQIVPVLDFLEILKGPGNKNTNSSSQRNSYPDGRIIILKLETEYFGLLVNSVDSINSYDFEAIMPIPLLSKERMKMFLGCINLENMGDVILLNQQEILSNKEILEVTQGHSSLYQSNQQIEEQKLNKTRGREVFILFHIKSSFGLPIKEIQEVIEYPKELLDAPGMPDFVRGILNLRGKLYTIVDTRALYKMPIQDHSVQEEVESKVIIFNRNGERFGLIIDSIDSILTVHNQERMPLPSIFEIEGAEYLQNDIKEALYVKSPNGEKIALVILDVDVILKRIRSKN